MQVWDLSQEEKPISNKESGTLVCVCPVPVVTLCLSHQRVGISSTLLFAPPHCSAPIIMHIQDLRPLDN